jgi:hypothetical protein
MNPSTLPHLDAATGQLALAEGVLVGPGTSRDAFLDAGIPAAARSRGRHHRFTLAETLGEPAFHLAIQFADQKLTSIELVGFPHSGPDRKARHDAWLYQELGEPPYDQPWGQYAFPWGRVASVQDVKNGESTVVISYRAAQPDDAAAIPRPAHRTDLQPVTGGIFSRRDFDVTLDEATAALERLTERAAQDAVALSILSQLRQLKAWTESGRMPSAAARGLFNFGLLASSALPRFDPVLAGRVMDLSDYLFMRMR